MPRSLPIAADPSGLPQGEGGRGLAHRLRRSWRWIAAPTLVAGLGAGAFVQNVTPLYTGEVKILLEGREAVRARSVRERGDPAKPLATSSMASQIEAVRSREITREAIRRLQLMANAEFDPAVTDFGPVQRLLMMIGLTANPLEQTPEERVREAYAKHLRVAPAGPWRTLSVAFRSQDPELAAQAANTIADLYIASLEAARTEAAAPATPWLGADIETLRTGVAEAEANLETYRARNGLLGQATDGQTLSARRLDELATQLAQARAVAADLIGRVKLIQEAIKDGRALEVRDVPNIDGLRRLLEQRSTLRGQLTLEARSLLPAHPRIKDLKAQLADLTAQIKVTAERVVRTLENDARIAEARAENLSVAVDAQRDVVAKGNAGDVQLQALEREAETQREQLDAALSRYRAASAGDAEAAAPAEARILSRAVVPATPSFPEKLPIVTLAMLLALLLSTGGLVLTQRATDPTPVRHGEPDEEADDAPMPAAANSVPALMSVAAPVEASAPAGIATAPHPERPARPRFALDRLLARLSEGGPGEAGRRILFVETDGVDLVGEADTLVGTLADAVASDARAVLLDLNGPACGPEEVGLTDLIAGEADFLEVIQRLPGSRVDNVQRGYLDSDILAEQGEDLDLTLDALAQTYDWVLCRLRPEEKGAVQALLEAVGRVMDTVVIASNRGADDAELVDLYTQVEASGARRILVAGDRDVAGTSDGDFASNLELRRSVA